MDINQDLAQNQIMRKGSKARSISEIIWAGVTAVGLTTSALLPFSGCSSSDLSTITPAPLSLPLGAQIAGATLSGPLAGKTLYYLGGGANFNKCWMDSEYWDGTTLWYGITSTSYTHLAATTPSYVADPSCVLPTSQVGTAFNIYAATLQNNSWNLTNLSFNTGVHNFAAPKISGSQMAFVSYEKGASSYGNIYLTTRTGANTWSTPTAFSLNSANCNEDNPDIYANGTKIIFESSRTNAAGTACNGSSSAQKLWQSNYSNGVWQTPTAVIGAPANAADATQPWLNEANGILYYTGDASVCGGSAANCILAAAPSGANWNTAATKLITPTALAPGVTNKLVFIGQYTEANGYAIASCAVATETDPTGTTASLYMSRWTLYISACVVPLN